MKRVLTLLMILLTLPGRVGAESQVQRYDAAPGEYVVSIANVSTLRKKALQELNKLSRIKLGILQQNKHVILVGPAGKPRRIPEEAIKVQPLEGLAGAVRRAKRQVRSSQRYSIAQFRIVTWDAQPNYAYRALRTPNDTHYSLEWGLHQSSDIDIDAPEAWDKSTGASSIVVAVIDSGVDYTHPDLVANMWTNTREIVGNNIDDDNNGYIDDYRGFNAITYSSSNRRAGDPMDDNGHGTHCAGTIGAASNNGIGIAGVTWNVKMVPIKFLSSSGQGYLIDAIEAVDYAVALKQNGVNLIAINNSWGGGPYTQELYNAIARARDAGLVFIVAAGNSSQNNDSTPSYPADYAVANVVSVGAIGQNGDLASFSNYGATSVDIAAPGVQIASTYPANRYVYLSGTSMAAPHVTGAIALLKSYSYGLDWQALINALYSSADISSVLQGRIAGGKTLNLNRLLSSVPSNPAPPQYIAPTPTPTAAPATPTPAPTATPTPTVAPGNFNLAGVATFNGAPISGVRVVLQYGTTSVVRLTTDNGQFRFDAVPGPVAYTLTLTKAGLQFSPLSGTLVRNTDLIVPAVGTTYTLKVKVQSPHRIPVAGVLVDAGPYGNRTTDNTGEVSFTVNYGALYSILPSSNQHRFSQPTITGELLGNTTRLIVARSSQ